MAWGSKQNVGWISVHDNGSYMFELYVWYQLDVENRKLRVRVDNERLVSKSSGKSYWWTTNNGHQILGGTNDEKYPRVYDAWDEFKVNRGGAGAIDQLKETEAEAENDMVAAVYSYNSDGTLPSIFIAWQMIMDVSSETPRVGGGQNYEAYSSWIQKDWTSFGITDKFPKLEKTLNGVTSVEVLPSDLNSTSSTVRFVGDSLATKYKLTITGNDQTNTIETTNVVYTFSHLKANTKYTVSICSVGSDGTTSSAVSIDFTTKSQATVDVNDNGTKKSGVVSVLTGSGNTRKLKKALTIWANVEGVKKQLI